MSSTSDKPRVGDIVQDNLATTAQDYQRHERQGKIDSHRPEETVKPWWPKVIQSMDWVMGQIKDIDGETDEIQISLECA